MTRRTVDARLPPHGASRQKRTPVRNGAFPEEHVPGKPGIYEGHAMTRRIVGAGLAPHGAFPAKPRAGRARHLRTG